MFDKQKKQKAVLVQVARKALETDTLHREEIASYGRRLLAADKTHDGLIDAATKLKVVAPPLPPHETARTRRGTFAQALALRSDRQAFVPNSHRSVHSHFSISHFKSPSLPRP